MLHNVLHLIRFQRLPDIATSAAFWASIATLWAASGAWFTFFGTWIASRNQTFEGIENLLEGLNAELDMVRDWAGGQAGGRGYLASKSQQEWVAERPDWFNPSRQIFTVNTPTLNSVTTSGYLSHITPLVGPIVALNQALRRLFDSHLDYRTLVHSEPILYRSVFRKLANTPNLFTPEEREYMNLIFDANFRMHVLVIGGADGPDICLHRAFRTAEHAIASFREHLRPASMPNWFWALHIVSAYLALNGIWQVSRWFGLL